MTVIESPIEDLFIEWCEFTSVGLGYLSKVIIYVLIIILLFFLIEFGKNQPKLFITHGRFQDGDIFPGLVNPVLKWRICDVFYYNFSHFIRVKD